MRMPITSRRTCSRNLGSKLEKGSSNSKTSGWGAKARPRATLCCWPPDSSWGILVRWAVRPIRVRTSATRSSLRWPFGNPYAMFCSTVKWGNNAPSWKTMPTLRRSGGVFSPALLTAWPAMEMTPSSGSSNPAMSLSAVVLPQPLGPSSARTWPLGMLKSRPATAGTPLKCLAKPMHSNAGASI